MILTPFGPKIYHGKIDEEVRLDLLRYAFDAEPSQDASGILAGQLEEQFYIYPSKRDLDELRKHIGTYTNQNYIDIEPIWVNFQRADDWQPVHNHAGEFSFIVYVDIPPGMYDEPEIAGSIVFTYGEQLPYARCQYGPIKPQAGDIYIFPAWLKHYVYPYKSTGQRVSVSGNIITRLNS